ncbi:hypothetical protein NKR23_g10295 [Pleurostoma richardsiae]|uniref:Uncharacterized protein n=1 Tax=Pleurostoma richardsiae TaxID=41990 RepID=A0AA38REU8_9PEZI|nr:hypothetical protein NKR23_g10295 [Pleurostoma richardsiae]
MHPVLLVASLARVASSLVTRSSGLIQHRDITPFNVTDFSAAVDPTPINGSIEFWVSLLVQVSAGESFTPCYAWAPSLNMTLGTITYTACNLRREIGFAWLKADGGFNLDIHYQFTGHMEDVGTYWIPDSQIVWGSYNGVEMQAYDGPGSFSIGGIKTISM